MSDGLSLDHIAITVQDMERAIDVYRDALGLEVLGQLLLNEGTFKLVYLQAGAGRIELFAVTVDDVDAVTRRLKAHDVRFTVEPTDAPGGVRLAFFHDPDGNLLGIVDRLPAWRRIGPADRSTPQPRADRRLSLSFGVFRAGVAPVTSVTGRRSAVAAAKRRPPRSLQL